MLKSTLTQQEMRDILSKKIEENSLDKSLFLSFLHQKTTRKEAHNFIDNGHALSEVSNVFKFQQQQVCIKDYENGSRHDLGDDLFSSMVSVGRNYQTINIIENFNLNTFLQSLKQDPIRLFKINDKYYLEQDGNHRMMALKLMYYIELSKPGADINQINKKFTFNFPVKHLNHDFDLISSAIKIVNKQKHSRFPMFYLTNDENQAISYKSILTFNNKSSTYNLDFQGKSAKNLTAKSVTELLKNLQSYNKPYSISKFENSFALEFGNKLSLNLTKNQLKEKINSLDLNQTTFPTEFLIVEKGQDAYDLLIEGKKYTGSEESIIKMYSAAVQANNNPSITPEEIKIMSEQEIDKDFHENLKFADIILNKNNSSLIIFGKSFKNISKKQLHQELALLAKERHFCPRQNFTVESSPPLQNEF